MGYNDGRYSSSGIQKTQLLAIILIIVIVASVGVVLIFMPEPVDNDYTPPVQPQPTNSGSYVMVDGTFDYIDVYTYYEGEGKYYKYQAHIEFNNEKYEISSVYQRSPETGISMGAQFGCFHVFIFNTTVSDYEFMLTERHLYNFELGGIEWEFYWFD